MVKGYSLQVFQLRVRLSGSGLTPNPKPKTLDPKPQTLNPKLFWVQGLGSRVPFVVDVSVCRVRG